MLFLPKQSTLLKRGLEKLDTYILLSNIGCPVFKSAVIGSEERIDNDLIWQLKKYFKTEEVTVRFQYIRPSRNPIQGGNRYKLIRENLTSLQNNDTLLWLLEPIDRLKNDYGINMYFRDTHCNIEVVGKGFDVSDLNRGHISPHQMIITELPIRMGHLNEWWKFLKYSFCKHSDYEISKIRRKQKLQTMGYNVTDDIFNNDYHPLPYDKVEEMITYIQKIYDYVNEKDFCVSSTIINNHFLFWDIQTPKGKKIIYGA